MKNTIYLALNILISIRSSMFTTANSKLNFDSNSSDKKS